MRKRLIAVSAGVLVLSSVPSPSAPQEAVGVSGVTAGDSVRVRMDGMPRWVEGRLLGMGPPILLRVGGDTIPVDPASLARIEANMRRSPNRGMARKGLAGGLIGAGAGALLAYVLYQVMDDQIACFRPDGCPSDPGPIVRDAAAFGAATGLVVGAISGYRDPGSSWREVRLDALRIESVPRGAWVHIRMSLSR